MNILKELFTKLLSFLSRVHLGRRKDTLQIVVKHTVSCVSTDKETAKDTAIKGPESDPSTKGSGDHHD